MTSGMATMFSMCTNGLRNLWRSPREAIGAFAQTNPPAIEYNVEHTIPKGDPTDNAPSIGDEKKPRTFDQILCRSLRIVCFIFKRARDVSFFLWKKNKRLHLENHRTP